MIKQDNKSTLTGLVLIGIIFVAYSIFFPYTPEETPNSEKSDTPEYENPEEEEEEEEAIVLNKLNNSINHYIFRNAFCIRLSKVNNVCFINYLTIIFH